MNTISLAHGKTYFVLADDTDPSSAFRKLEVFDLDQQHVKVYVDFIADTGERIATFVSILHGRRELGNRSFGVRDEMPDEDTWSPRWLLMDMNAQTRLNQFAGVAEGSPIGEEAPGAIHLFR